MKIAEVTSTLSYAKRLQVGAVIVKDNKILATGYNGMPSGWENNCEELEVLPYDIQSIDSSEIWHQYPNFGKIFVNGQEVQTYYKLKTKPEVLHAESNAIAKVSRSTESSEGSTLFCTHAPCLECAKLIYQAGISSVYYREQYRDDSGVKFLNQGGVNVHQYTDSV